MSARPAPPDTQYDATLVSAASGRPLTLATVAAQLAETDVVVVGEYHGHHGSHLLQSRLQAALYRRNPEQVLTLEQFDLNHQPALDRYLNDELGETELIEDAEAWNNYRASYRPLVEFAKAHGLPVIAANAPSDIVRCVGRQGPDYLDTLDSARRSQLPQAPFADTPAYQDKFVAAMTGSHGLDNPGMNARMQNSYRAQLLRDNTMASRILEAHRAHPGHQILHLTGTFHSEDRLGTVALLEQRAPELSVAVLTPVFWSEGPAGPALETLRGKGDYLYFIQPLPEEFRDPERAHAAMTARFSESPPADCD